MELKQLWAVIVRWWWLIILPTLIALALTLPSLRNMISPPPGYAVNIRFTASQPPAADSAHTFEDQSYIPWLASEYAVVNLAAWMRTDTFADEIANVLKAQGTDLAPATVRGAIANADAARSIMTLYLAWPNPDEIKLIAGAAIKVLREQNQVYFPQFGAQKAVITPLDDVIVVPTAPPITSRFSPLVRILIGLAAGLALAFLAEYLDPTIRNRRDVEALFDLPVLSEIPPHR
jgi:capsular polysaccharide biosynthesis protein